MKIRKFKSQKAWAVICESSVHEFIPDCGVKPEEKIIGGFYAEKALMIYSNKTVAKARGEAIIPVLITLRKEP